MNATKRPRPPTAIMLPDAEVDEIVEILRSPQVLANLSGRQRHRLEEICQELGKAKRSTASGCSLIRVTTLVLVLRSLSGCFAWSKKLADFLTDDGVD